jgi:hypothetical protein
MPPPSYPTLAETIRRLGPVAQISLQPYEDHLTGELWSISVDHNHMGQGETLEMAFADLATTIASKGN